MTTVNQTDSSTSYALAQARANTASAVDDVQDRFLTLLVTQLQNQDPLNPMDNAEVTSQMAQLSTVSGINQLNNTLLALSGQMDVSQSMQAANLIGKGVLVPGSKIALGGEGDQREATPFGVDLIAPADSVVVTVMDAAGKAVRQIDLGPQAAGVLSVTWDGTGDGGLALPDGAYTAKVTATNEDGSAVSASALTYGVVSSVAYSSNGLQLDLGLAGNYSLLDIRKIM
ncbi:flagellar basal body rod modification protein [Allopusillimonas soli]|uniref:Basal-body rod modification protein FlgD n=1 Tax=Allopusillimonas soli TaxID=659016 RepID=A0A853FBT1_9BURK|nr:flagellar hook capping FlgD N-terminal domain-containing protein [Allopusillimonas soli]NYT35526.1 flagellar hook assembly protein FlgD [Allopusillimonas soli]TEA75932.1 flagellar basal body rod modification protein [Allopusillimonas soli]